MRKLIFGLFCFALLAFVSSTGAWNPVTVGGSTPAAGGACTQFYSETTGTDYDFSYRTGHSATGDHFGGVIVTLGSTRCVCQVDFFLTMAGTDISGYTYHAEIWTLSGDNLDAQQGTDGTGVSGNNGWSDTEVAFAFGTCVNLSAGSYAFVLESSSDDEVSHVQMEYTTSNNDANNRHGSWESDGTAEDVEATADGNIEIHAE